MDQFLIQYRVLARIVAWTAICGIFILSVIPANERPVVAGWWLDERVGHFIEHFSAFALAAAAFAIGYYRFSLLQVLLFAFVFSAGIELLQVLLPTRHARVSDFVIDFLASCIGIVVARMYMGTGFT